MSKFVKVGMQAGYVSVRLLPVDRVDNLVGGVGDLKWRGHQYLCGDVLCICAISDGVVTCDAAYHGEKDMEGYGSLACPNDELCGKLLAALV